MIFGLNDGFCMK